MSFKPVVKTGNDPKWYDNSLRFATHEEAYESARDLASRWMLVTNFSAHESEDAVNYQIVDGVVRPVKTAVAGGV